MAHFTPIGTDNLFDDEDFYKQIITCPECDKTFEADLRKKVTCPHCGIDITIDCQN